MLLPAADGLRDKDCLLQGGAYCCIGIFESVSLNRFHCLRQGVKRTENTAALCSCTVNTPAQRPGVNIFLPLRFENAAAGCP